MNLDDVRLTALKYAESIDNHGSVRILLDNASRIEEYLTCKIKKYDTPESIIDTIKIRHPKNGLIPFVKYPHQEILWRSIDVSDRLVINTARQMGLTTLYSVYAVSYALKNPASRVKIVKTGLQGIKEVLSVLVDQTNPKRVLTDGTTVEYDNGSVISGITTNNLVCIKKDRETGKEYETSIFELGERVDLLIIDDAACISFKYDGIMHNIFQNPYFSKIIISSDPHESRGFFYNVWTNDNIDVNKFMLPWYMHPDRNSSWAESTINLIGKDLFLKEYCCKFANW